MIKKFSDSEIAKSCVRKDRIKILAYIELMYDQKSELNKIQDLQERKEAAMVMAKLSPQDEEMKQIMAMKNEEVNELIFHYLTFYQNNIRYQKYCSDLQFLWYMMNQLMKPFDAPDGDNERQIKTRALMSMECDNLIARLEHAKSDIWGTDDVKAMAEHKVKAMLSPEKRLKQEKK
jgi:hypothetical protein